MKVKKYIIILVCFILLCSGAFVFQNCFKKTQPVFSKKIIRISGLIGVKTQQELIAGSDLIVIGNVTDNTPSKWSNPDYLTKGGVNDLTTDYNIKIEKVLRGQPYNNSQVAVRINKGETADTIVKSEGYPDFTKGEKILLFLSKDDSPFANTSENYYVLTGMLQGKYVVKSGEDIFENEDDKKTIDLKTFNKTIQDTPVKDYEAINKQKEKIKADNEKILGK